MNKFITILFAMFLATNAFANTTATAEKDKSAKAAEQTTATTNAEEVKKEEEKASK